MNVALRRSMTVAEFLAWEERQPTKYEFDGMRPVAMVGVTNAHSIIQSNLIIALGARLRGTSCRIHGSDFKIRVAGRIRYSDALVVCRMLAADAKLTAEPTVVFEIVSESSRHTDLMVKNHEYRGTPSIQHYVVLEQTRAECVVFNRFEGEWLAEALDGRESVMRLPAIGVEVALTEIYADVPFPSR